MFIAYGLSHVRPITSLIGACHHRRLLITISRDCTITSPCLCSLQWPTPDQGPALQNEQVAPSPVELGARPAPDVGRHDQRHHPPRPREHPGQVGIRAVAWPAPRQVHRVGRAAQPIRTGDAGGRSWERGQRVLAEGEGAGGGLRRPEPKGRRYHCARRGVHAKHVGEGCGGGDGRSRADATVPSEFGPKWAGAAGAGAAEQLHRRFGEGRLRPNEGERISRE